MFITLILHRNLSNFGFNVVKTDSNDLPDLGETIDEANALQTNESFHKELEMELHDDVDMIESLQETAESLDASDADAYMTGDVEDKTIGMISSQWLFFKIQTMFLFQMIIF